MEAGIGCRCEIGGRREIGGGQRIGQWRQSNNLNVSIFKKNYQLNFFPRNNNGRKIFSMFTCMHINILQQKYKKMW
jgi:hypothetical protein